MAADPQAVPVLIVGGGPTGVTAATLLARYGVRSLVVERHPDVYPLPRAVHLDGEVLRILQHAGVAEEFAKISMPAPGMRLLDGRLRTMAEFRRRRTVGEHGWPQANMFDQPDLERLLRDDLRRHPEAELRGGTVVEDVRTGTGHGTAPLRVRLRDLDGGRTSWIRAHAVLGCDGAGSVVRRVVGARMRDLRFEERWLVVDVLSDVPLDMWDGVHQVCDPRRATTFMRLGPRRYRWEFRLRPGETETGMTGRETIRRLLEPWLRDRGADRVRILRQAVYTFRAQVADRWRNGRVFLLGDAAHLTPPFIGQGLGAGLRDAANLAWKLALVLCEGADERILDTYEAERRPHATRMIRLAVTVGWAMTGGQDGAAALRRALLAGACRIPGFTQAALHAGTPRLPRGTLVRPRRPQSLRDPAGTLLPQPWVTAGGRRRRLDEVLGDSFAVIGAEPLDPALAALAARLRACVLVPGGPVEDGGELAAWLRRMDAGAVLVRPDRVVLASAPPGTGGRGIARDAAAWLPLFPPTRTVRARLDLPTLAQESP